MNEPKRLLDSGSGHLRTLVEAGKGDQPDRHLQEKVLGALGLGATGGAGLIAGAPDALARSGIAKFFGGLRRAALSKAGIGVIAAVTASSAGYLAASVHERARAAATRSATRGAPAAAPVPLRPLALEPSVASVYERARAAATRSATRGAPAAAPIPLRPLAPEPSVASAPVTPGTASADSLPSVTPAAAVAPRFGSRGASALASGSREGSVLAAATATAYARGSDDASPAPEAHADTVAPAITVQLESIRHARALVAEGDARAALVELDAYDTRYPHGIFEEEAMALRVRALRIAGDAAGADRERTNLQSRFPKSVHLTALGN
jgi:hypothetical protein